MCGSSGGQLAEVDGDRLGKFTTEDPGFYRQICHIESREGRGGEGPRNLVVELNHFPLSQFFPDWPPAAIRRKEDTLSVSLSCLPYFYSPSRHPSRRPPQLSHLTNFFLQSLFSYLSSEIFLALIVHVTHCISGGFFSFYMREEIANDGNV